jgi:hypothetical protein
MLMIPYLNQGGGLVVHTCHPSYVVDINGRIKVHASLSKNVELYLKNN